MTIDQASWVRVYLPKYIEQLHLTTAEVIKLAKNNCNIIASIGVRYEGDADVIDIKLYEGETLSYQLKPRYKRAIRPAHEEFDLD